MNAPERSGEPTGVLSELPGEFGDYVRNREYVRTQVNQVSTRVLSAPVEPLGVPVSTTVPAVISRRLSYEL
jgi:hypothetical protein